jgi:hypothetical protein
MGCGGIGSPLVDGGSSLRVLSNLGYFYELTAPFVGSACHPAVCRMVSGSPTSSSSWPKRLPALLKRPSRPNPSGQSNPVKIVFSSGHPSTRPPWDNEPPLMTAAMPERRPATEEISGVIERVTFHNDDSGFCVLIRFKCWFPASREQSDKITGLLWCGILDVGSE